MRALTNQPSVDYYQQNELNQDSQDSLQRHKTITNLVDALISLYNVKGKTLMNTYPDIYKEFNAKQGGRPPNHEERTIANQHLNSLPIERKKKDSIRSSLINNYSQGT